MGATEYAEIEFKLRKHQLEAFNEFKRFNIMVCHRRWGKTYLAIIWLLNEIWHCDKHNPRGYYYASSYAAAKKIAWQYIKDFTRGFDDVTYNESELRVNWGSRQIQLGSSENPDSSRGIYADAVCMDEVAQMPTRMYSEVLRPAIADRLGTILMIGTPQGRFGLFHDSWQEAQTDPTWSHHIYKASETGIIETSELEAMRKHMTAAEYNQELEVSFDAAVQGAYWASTVTEIEDAGQITTVSHDPAQLVSTSWDLGVRDSTAIWFVQFDGDRYNIIDYEEYTNLGFPQIVAELKRKPYQYGNAVIPHDGSHMSLSTGLKRSQTLSNLGLETVQAPKAQNNGDVTDHIDLCRTKLHRCWFDRDKCRHGIEALRQYSAEWNTLKGVAMLKPAHNWCSHGADSFRYLMTTPISSIIGTWSSGEIDYSAMDQGIVSAN